MAHSRKPAARRERRGADEHREAAQALGRGDSLRALGLVGRASDAVGVMLRGIAYAQMGDLDLARGALEKAAKLEGPPLVRTRIRAALVEIAMAEGDAASAAREAAAIADDLTRLGDTRNAAMQRLVVARAEVLLGRLAEARHVVREVLDAKLPADVTAVAWLASAEIAIRSIAATEARAALTKARGFLAGAPNELLARVLVALEAELTQPVARLERRGVVRDADLYAIEAASSGEVLLVDACRRVVIGGRVTVPLAKRPVLFALVTVLAGAWPVEVERDALASLAFDARRVNASHRSRLRVEIGRLRKLLAGIAEPVATENGYMLASTREVVLLRAPSDDDDARVAILLGDGAAWSAQAIAEHAGISKRTAQRALAQLVESGGAVRSGQGRETRYVRPGPRIASRMLLLGLVPAS